MPGVFAATAAALTLTVAGPTGATGGGCKAIVGYRPVAGRGVGNPVPKEGRQA